MNNKYVNRSKISEAKFRELVRLFVMDLTAIQISELSGLNRNTVNRYLTGIRERITEYCMVTAPIPVSSREVNLESSIGLRLVGIMEQGGDIYTGLPKPKEIEKIRVHLNRKQEKRFEDSLEVQVFQMLIDPDSRQRIYLCTESYYRGNSARFRRMEGFWGFAQSRLEKFKGLHDSTYCLHLKECEFRYNHSKDTLYQLILRIVRNKPLF